MIFLTFIDFSRGLCLQNVRFNYYIQLFNYASISVGIIKNCLTKS